jgi:colicin import membrane protein
MVTHPEVFDDNPDQTKMWMGMLILSALCHVLFLSGMLFFPSLNFRAKHIPASVEIDLVSLPAGSPAAKRQEPAAPAAMEAKQPPAKEKVAPAPVEKPKEPTPAPKEAVPISPVPVQVKKSLKKKTFDASKAINQAIDKLEKTVPDSRPPSVLQAIDALRKKEGQTSSQGAGTQGVGAGVGMGGSTKKHLEMIDIYNAEIWGIIQRNWAFSEEMVGSRKDLEAIVNIKIMRNGEIRDIYFDTKTGLGLFDESVLKAVKKSNPLPPLPEGFLGPYYDVGLRFNLSELRRRQ